MEKLGTVRGLFAAKPESKGFPRPKIEEMELVEGYGIKGDKFAEINMDRTVLITGTKPYELALEHGIKLEDGSLGENILFDFNPHDLKIGNKIKIEDAEIEITESCTICSHLAVFGAELPQIVKDYRGLYCKINRSGKIKKGSVAFKQ